MRRLTLTCLAILLLSACYAKVEEQPTGPFDFRKTRWGMSRREVLSSEREEPIYKSLNRLLYATSVIDKQVMLQYDFGNDQLYRARYILVAKHVVDDKYVTDYQDIQGVLTAKYGKPKRNETIWKKGAGIRHDLQPGVSVSIGHLTMVSEWETPQTEIIAALSGKDFKIQCEVTYTSKVYQPLVQSSDQTDPSLGGQGGELGNAFENKALQDATRNF